MLYIVIYNIVCIYIYIYTHTHTHIATTTQPALCQTKVRSQEHDSAFPFEWQGPKYLGHLPLHSQAQ